MAKTLLDATNHVLRLLRENTVSDVEDTAYSRMVVDLINEAKREVEDAWDWSHNRQTVTVTTEQGTYDYTLTDVTSRATPVLSSCEVFSGFNRTEEGTRLHIVESVVMDTWHSDPNTTQEKPTFIHFRSVDQDDQWVIRVWPIPDGVYDLDLEMYVPQADLEASTDIIRAPYQPIVMRAWVLAISERGEDGGASWDEANRRAERALGDAIQLDANLRREELTVVPL